MEKKPFVTKEQLEEIIKQHPTPFHLYDEKGIRENAARLAEAFAWNKGYREYFAVKATPNPYLLKILKECGCGTDCSSATELMLSDAVAYRGMRSCSPPMIRRRESSSWQTIWEESSIWMILLIFHG